MGADAQLVEASARIAELEAEVAELKRNSQGPVPSTSLSKSLLAARAVFQVLLLAICLWGAIISTINYREAPSMKTSSMTPQLSTLKNAADDCPVAVHETKLVLQGGVLELQEQKAVDSEGRRRMTDSDYTAVGSPTCQMALTIAENYENGVDHVVIPCTACDGVKMYPLLSPLMVAEQEGHFTLRGHIGAPLNALYEIKCCYPRPECETRPKARCALAPVPTDGVLNQACPEPDPEADPETSDGRMLFEADGGHEKSGFIHEESLESLEKPDRFEKQDLCADKPDHLVALAAENLELPAATCAELAAVGGCELEVVADLCGKTCGACDVGGEGGGRRRLAKCR
mmetsp:Transcript_28959/g.87676  ORF Transcript_28959/g.87676 Transcript_28959/m.87676 type:complete len:344 (-) Transcript_28959:226-1257(-)